MTTCYDPANPPYDPGNPTCNEAMDVESIGPTSNWKPSDRDNRRLGALEGEPRELIERLFRTLDEGQGVEKLGELLEIAFSLAGACETATLQQIAQEYGET